MSGRSAILAGLALGCLLALPAQDKDLSRGRFGSAREQAPEAQRVDINRASIEELMRVPGMTRSWAGRIVRFKPYRSKQDLVDNGIVTGEFYERIRGYIVAHRVPRP
ncbi:MAG: helix-hairpin-helix domain-containing protein [Terracidiphilus sp.]